MYCEALVHNPSGGKEPLEAGLERGEEKKAGTAFPKEVGNALQTRSLQILRTFEKRRRTCPKGEEKRGASVAAVVRKGMFGKGET